MNAALAEQLIEAAVAQATEFKITVCIAVTDSAGLLTGFIRMDNSFQGSVDVAIKKARTAALFPIPTGVFGQLMRDENLTGMAETNGGLIGFPGGLPLQKFDQLIGAIGISGGSAEQDHAIAAAAAGILETP
ncbi:heme-binding protein [Neptuniibacter sp. CAU 1671]|uniref:GlcG/HbpS family heme-binding protein n=1 Tax=Neptuniibacter sp. CAU 1671 TaxID=3032593 RepID=UPI0023DACE28|nr:heme-binding protein [Neptuniibacter sp. CAU 1671]MDF2180601.1 heme-binding protein [Neptuniibacter sp. CAU 1671]